MEVLFKDINTLLDSKITVAERGILVTILLMKDPNPKITLAKVKTSLRFALIREELISLQDKKLIKWSGYKAALKARESDSGWQGRVDVINFMNNLWGLKTKTDNKAVHSLIAARLKENSIEQVKLVIANRWNEWKDDKVMFKNLRPTTVFRKSKFDKYLEEAERTGAGEGLVTIDRIKMEKGSTITTHIAEKLAPDDVYVVRVFKLIGKDKYDKGAVIKRLGADLHKSLKFCDNEAKFSGEKEFIIKYEGE